MIVLPESTTMALPRMPSTPIRVLLLIVAFALLLTWTLMAPASIRAKTVHGRRRALDCAQRYGVAAGRPGSSTGQLLLSQGTSALR